MKTSPLLSRFPGGSMRIGAPGRKHAVQHVDMLATGERFRKLRFSFRAPDGRVTDLELSRAQAWCLIHWALDESTKPYPKPRTGRKPALTARSL
jgi:hypothetical protein